MTNRLVLNTESNGRFHSFWLSMMFPRLKLARNLLTEDGVILISIDDNEYENARKLCGEVFGDANFIANMVWEKGRKNDAKLVSVGHEYVLIFAKSLSLLREQKTIWREEKPGARDIWEQYLELRNTYGKDDALIEKGLQAWYSALPKSHPAKKWSRYKRVDANGPWRDDNISWPGGDGPRYDVIHPKTGRPCKVPERGWVFASLDTMKLHISAGLVEFREDHTEPPFRKSHIRPIPMELETEVESEDEIDSSEEEFATQVRGSYFYKQSQVSVKFLRNLLGGKAFDNPKDHLELSRLIGYITANNADAIIMDFFAGSASTGHAVLECNLADRGSRRFVLVQLPQVLDPEKKNQKIAAKYCDQIGKPRTIAEISKERLRRAGQTLSIQLKSDTPIDLLTGETGTSPTLSDTGFRVLKIDTSNMEPVFYSPEGVKQESLLAHIENIRPGRTSEDLLFQVLLDWGVDLALPIQRETLAGKEVFFVDETALAACFEGGIEEEFVKALAKRKPLRVVFRDAGFADDAVKINVGQIFKSLSPDTELKVI